MAKNILDSIIDHKRQEVADAKQAVTIEELKQSAYFARQTLSLKRSLLDDSKTGIIAEFKRKSPSKGIFNAVAKAADITATYTLEGASGISVLTDEHFFGGSADDLRQSRKNEIPILRKDFIVDEYQLFEARAMGADVILLIAACHSPARVRQLAIAAQELDLEVLLEIHDDSELPHICDEIDLVGVNNRDLKTFSVDVQRSIGLADKIPDSKIKISESGISNVDTILLLKEHGFKGFLIGETFMKERDPAIAFARFVHELKTGTL